MYKGNEMRSFAKLPAILVTISVLPAVTSAQHLIWKPKPGDKKITCLYGEIEVLATGSTIYYCGCNWWPGNPAGGYTGIQDAGHGRHLVIFSIWDTSPTLPAKTVNAESRTRFNRFGGEGEGAHTHLDYNWKLGKTYRYYVTKQPDATGANTLTRMYFYDEGMRKWVHEATISSPNDGHDSVPTFGGMLNAFLENWSGQERAIPKLALYRLWIGDSPADMVNVIEASGDGNWGVLNDTFFLAEGDNDALGPIFEKARKPGSQFIRGLASHSILTIYGRRLPASVMHALEKLSK